ncbi:VENN motif pre-toxin domain-containing protein, partial [Photorhabdus sp. P32]|uniref:VENN motif pre-toxin domain-containing protein n=1 Tax=Photorhabdus sp. P32 TaxID=3117549 RepID=UPI00311AD2D8
QENVSAGTGFTYGSMSGSASVNASRDKMHSKFESVKEQTGIFAGKGGFDISVGEHTQLDGAVIGSTADKDRNRLETGTLGFSDIRNKAEYKTEHQSVGMSTGGAVGSQLVSNLSSNMLSGANHSDSKSSTTHAAVSDGTITVRDTDKQKQDIAGLSRDTENAANGLTPIFDKEKEQRRLAQAQAIANIGIQVMDIYNTQESITAMKKATEALKDPERQQALKQQAEAQLKQENGIVTAETIADRAYKIAYDGAIKGQGADIGGNRRQAVTAVVAALQGLAGGDIKAAIASGAAPYLSNAVKKVTYGDKAYEQLTPEEKATNVVAHAILGGVIAELKGGSAIAGSVGAAGGELAASVIAGALYPDKKLSELTADEKEKISHLSTLAGGIAAGLVTDSTAGGVDGAQTAKNATDNNHLSVDQNRSRSEELVNCQGDSSCRTTVRDKYRQEYDKVQARITSCTGAEQCVAVAKELRALQGDYSARMSEIQEKARMQGLDSLTPAEVREWADLRGAMSNIDASRNLVLHRAQVTGGSEETTQEIVKIMGQTGIAASAGVTGGISKAGVKGSGDVGKGKQPPNPITDTESVFRVGDAQLGKNITKGTTGNVSTFNANEVRLSQNSVSYNKTDRITGEKYTYNDLVNSMKKDGWKGNPIDVVKMPDGKMTSMDNTRVTAAREARIEIKANVRSFNEPLTPEMQKARGWEQYNTWGEAIQARINNQSGKFSELNPYGAEQSPKIRGRK